MTHVEADRRELARLEKEWMEAMQQRETGRLEQLVAPEFVFTAIHIDPDPMSRDAWMGAAMGGYTISSFYYDEMAVVVAGDTGIVHARPRPLFPGGLLRRAQPLRGVPPDRRVGAP